MGMTGKLALGGLLASVAAASLPGCQEEPNYGYVHIKSEIKLANNDVYSLNGSVIDGMKGSNELVLKHKAGSGKLVLHRRGRTWTLCAFSIQKNRIVTATLRPVNGTIKCVVQG